MRINRPLTVAVPVALLLGFVVFWRSLNPQSPVESARPIQVHPLLTSRVLPPAPQSAPAGIANSAIPGPAEPRDRAGQFAAFNSWAEKYLAAATPALQEALLAAELTRKGKTAKQIREAVIRGEHQQIDLRKVTLAQAATK